MSKENLIKRDLSNLENDFKRLLLTADKDKYNLGNISLSSIRTVLESIHYSLKEESAPEGWSYDFSYSIIDSNNKKQWYLQGSLWYGDIVLSKL